MMRYMLLFGVNIGIMIMISIVLSVLGFDSYMTSSGIDYYSLMVMCLFWGMGGSFISLFMSKWMAKWMMKVEIVDATGQYSTLVQSVHGLARAAGITKMPEVGVYPSNDLNAFATGPSKNNSLVAVSTGLLNSMNRDELDGVLAHEVAHIANGDMVTMTLIQGVVNAFVMFFARIAAFAVSQLLRGDDEEGGLGPIAHMFTVIAFQLVFGIIGSGIVAWFSRYREFRADAGSAALGGSTKMIKALKALQRNYEGLGKSEASVASMQISSKNSWLALLSTHPSLEKRIAALEGRS